MSDINKTARKLHEVIKEASKEKKGGYDTPATVKRIENGVAWVQIPGGVDETPATLTINAKEGDRVQVRVSGGRATLTGNASSPPTDNTEAYNAMNQASTAAKAAAIAQQKADEAIEDAARAHAAADEAEAHAQSAAEDAASARADAESAKADAETANDAANSALHGLSLVEDVTGTLQWIQEHGSYTATTDTTVVDGVIYFEYINGEYMPMTNPDPEANPSAEGWYVLDLTDSQAEFIRQHLAVTDMGLWVLPNHGFYPLTDESGNVLESETGKPLYALVTGGYKALLSNEGMTIYDSSNNILAVYSTDITLGKKKGWRVLVTPGDEDYTAGVYLIDPDGNIAQSTTAQGVAFDTGKPITIGDSTASIVFDGNGHINMVGADVTIGGANNVNGVLTILGSNGAEIGKWNNDGLSVLNKFKVTNAGKMEATEADISGKITSTDGSIGGWTIENGKLSSSMTSGGVTYTVTLNSFKESLSPYAAMLSSTYTVNGVTESYVTLTFNGEMYLKGRRVVTEAIS